MVVNPDDKVICVNRDRENHAMSVRNGSWETDVIEPGGQTAVVVIKSRSGEYYCRLQSHLTGVLKMVG
ncbi:MAG: hypothetical protein CMO26_23405 [Thiotrichales bacterium]|nr:hypothetical protein [Thiotrichales bacterium]